MTKFKYFLNAIFHPMDGFDEMRHHNGGSVLWSIPMFLLFALSIVFKRRYVGRQFEFIDETKVSMQTIVLCTVGLLLAFAVSNWAISVLLDGKAKFKDIWIILNYSLMPYTFFSYLYIIISNVATLEEGVLLKIVLYVGIIWSAVLVISSLMSYQEFSFLGTIGSIVLTAVGVIIILFLAVLIFSLFQQLFGTISTVFYELSFRFK